MRGGGEAEEAGSCRDHSQKETKATKVLWAAVGSLRDLCSFCESVAAAVDTLAVLG
jgi:hypothetical protein